MSTLPVGYRPAGGHIYTAWSNTGAQRLDVLNSGNVTPNGIGTAFASLSGIPFFADAKEEGIMSIDRALTAIEAAAPTFTGNPDAPGGILLVPVFDDFGNNGLLYTCCSS